MKYCDLTIAYNESSGGIRTYIDEKRRYILGHTEHEHVLVVPGADDHVDVNGRARTVTIDSPLLPNQDNYRCFIRPDKIRDVLLAERPDIIELGSYYLCPWAAYAYRDRLRESGGDCLIGCFFHTDVAEAYVAAPLRAIAQDWFDPVSELLGDLAEWLADFAGDSAERYMRRVFELADLAFAPSPAQAGRLREYGVEDVWVVPLGVDAETFHPRHRSPDVRAQFGAGPDTLVLIYAGRLSTEKRVLTLVEALDHLPPALDARLWMLGDGPLADELHAAAEARPALRLMPFESDRATFAGLLASADVYVTAGPHETFALSVIEAQACGLPVVGVAVGALVERVPPGLGFLGPVDDAAAMAENIVRAAANAADIGQRARAHVEAHFTWDVTFGTLLGHYAAALPRLTGQLPSRS